MAFTKERDGKTLAEKIIPDEERRSHSISRRRGSADIQQAIFAEFASRDAAYHQTKTKELLRQVDWHLLPLLIMMYLLNFLDRSKFTLSAAPEADVTMKTDGKTRQPRASATRDAGRRPWNDRHGLQSCNKHPFCRISLNAVAVQPDHHPSQAIHIPRSRDDDLVTKGSSRVASKNI